MKQIIPFAVLGIFFVLITILLAFHTVSTAPIETVVFITTIESKNSAQPSSEAPPVLFPYASLAENPINLNTATIMDLEQLPGIGSSKAMAIYEYVQQQGSLTSIDQLLEVSGIGEKTLENLRPYVTLQ